jgi:uncharacterized protein YcgL (UPF0745 family)
MCADIYRTRDANTFLLVPRGAAFDSVPKELLARLGPPEFLNTRELNDPLLGIDSAVLNAELERQGFSVRNG